MGGTDTAPDAVAGLAALVRSIPAPPGRSKKVCGPPVIPVFGPRNSEPWGKGMLIFLRVGAFTDRFLVSEGPPPRPPGEVLGSGPFLGVSPGCSSGTNVVRFGFSESGVGTDTAVCTMTVTRLGQ